ncbi:hypothetical protein BABINDRAFT_159120 [Babjeviella inositovora NRRL Y-12698]|uniref:NTF2 domain-containing protein n=1 Tax=Babjeviella inositovora NRRL Y-12698 TaxID=984486 RepID=A0A1E3QY70_9ASCO|nr:uncharacterized protein BABINDRAFT_159120 [Babjeviella inositovora NRRL Y-12698]ODQ82556.1 hypothetical protein BABINDRAFT_159120 [Babjeviella inositovora NRRL Y-12698]
MSYRGRGRGGYGNQGNRTNETEMNHQQKVNNFADQSRVAVEIRNWNNGTLNGLVNFISRTCKVALLDATVNHATGAVDAYVKFQKDADTLKQYNGLQFSGQGLVISVNTNTSTTNTIGVLKEFIARKYNPAMKLLDLSLIQQDAELVRFGLILLNLSKMFSAIMKLASQLNLDVETVNLANNNLTDLATIASLPATFPGLVNLSLADNKLSKPRVFETWKKKLNSLRELVLTNNAVVNDVTAIPDILKCFPRLVVLNGVTVRDEAKLTQTFTFPITTSPMFFENPSIQELASGFIANYIKLWDDPTSRDQLLSLYTPESQFSLQVDSSHPHMANDTAYNYNESPWSHYLVNSRNLTKLSNGRTRLAKLCKGQEQIQKQFATIPATKHLILESPADYAMESWQFPQLGGLFVVLHGSFEETAHPKAYKPPQGGGRRYNNNALKAVLSKKSFDRTFVVVPGPNGSMIIASDMLLLRPFGGSKAWNKTAAPVASIPVAPVEGAVPGTNVVIPAEILSSLQPAQRDLLMKVIAETRLNLEYSGMLCQGSNWDYQTCIVNFNSSKATLPREAYQA